MKDLATLRSPKSPITYLAYLHSQGRLVDFINRGNTTPTRKEYSDYLAYVARYVQDQGIKIAYGEDVIAVEEEEEEEEEEGTVQVYSRVIATGEIMIRHASQFQRIAMLSCVIDWRLLRKFNHLTRRLTEGPAVYQGHLAPSSSYSHLCVPILCRTHAGHHGSNDSVTQNRGCRRWPVRSGGIA